ncbi:MAG: HD-GYP domain-containing protein [Bacillota bacterium]
MRRLMLTQLVSGMKVGQNVYGKDGQVWLARGAILTRRYIEHLFNLGIPSIYIDDGLMGDREIRGVVREETRQQAVQQVKSILLDSSTCKTGVIKPSPGIYRTVERIVGEIMQKPGVMFNLMDIRMEDEYLFYHSANVCILSVLAGVNLGFDATQLMELGMGALLHDVGKMRVPQEILNKPGSLTEQEFNEVKKHTLYGEEMLENLFPARIIARSHHERLNGEGYPDRLEGFKIPVIAQITGMADVYDAMTADRIYRKAYQPHEAFEMLSATGDFWFEHAVVKAFLNNIAAFPVGCIVRLTSGEVAVVLENIPGFSLYPQIRPIIGKNGEILTETTDFWCYEAGLGIAQILKNEEVTALGLALIEPAQPF